MMRIGHRGASKVAPENTIAAIKEALFIGVDFIEIDVRLSKDGVPILCHDESVERTTNCKTPLLVENMTLSELKELDAGSWFDAKFKGEKIPTLEETIHLDYGVTGLMIEIKEGNYSPKTIVSNVIKALKNRDCAITIGSFSLEIVRELLFHAVDQNWTVIGIVEKEELLMPFRQMELKRLAIWYPLLNPTLIQMLHEEKTEVWAFTVDDLKKAHFLHSINVDGVISNNPKKLVPA